jgi:hypothetical protein
VTASSPPFIAARDRVATVARAIGPILNRVVLAGPPVIGLLADDPAVHAPDLEYAADATLQLLSTSMIDRLGGDLLKLGLSKTGRVPNGDRWRAGADVEFDLIQVQTDDGEPGDVWPEYATLLTLPLVIDPQLTLRIAGAPAMLALEFSAFAASRANAFDSEELERAVLLIATRTEIERECSAAPPELRSFLGAALRQLAQNDALQFIMKRALPDTAILPVLASRVRERILRMAS